MDEGETRANSNTLGGQYKSPRSPQIHRPARAFQDVFANHSVVDGRLVTGQNQNAGAEVAHKMMMTAKGGLR